MELNGVANIKVMLEMALTDQKISLELHQKLTNQCSLLERYMLAYMDSKDSAVSDVKKEVPHWHEIVANPEKYPNMKERF